MRLFYDILHGIDRTNIPLVVALEFAILLGHDGQLNKNTDLEKELFKSTIEQFKKTEMTKMENALMWLYAKSWGSHGQHVVEKTELWNFGSEDLELAIMRITFPRKESNERITDLKRKDQLIVFCT